LEAAIPALEEAKAALSNINKASLDEIKALANPAQAIVDVCMICFFLYPKTNHNDTSWANIKIQTLNDTKLLDNLKSYDVSKTRADGANKAKKRMEKLIKDLGCALEEVPKVVANKSFAAGGLFKWCTSTITCYDINKEVEPKKKKAAQMNAEKEKGEKELAETMDNLEKLNKMLSELNANKKIQQDELDELQRKSSEMTRKLNAASQLITGLGGE